MVKTSAGLLLFRRRATGIEFFLVHPGGPFWAKKDEGAWSIPKGEYDASENPLQAADREFTEETGIVARGYRVPLGEFRQPGGKRITAWMVEFDCDPAVIKSNTFTMEWPPRSGRQQEFPEVDRAGWFGPLAATKKLVKGQRPIIERALSLLGTRL